jgi:hypothetical protein
MHPNEGRIKLHEFEYGAKVGWLRLKRQNFPAALNIHM